VLHSLFRIGLLIVQYIKYSVYMQEMFLKSFNEIFLDIFTVTELSCDVIFTHFKLNQPIRS